MIETIIYATSLVLAALCGWNLHTVFSNHRYYRLRNNLAGLIEGLTASNITDIDLDRIRNELQKDTLWTPRQKN